MITIRELITTQQKSGSTLQVGRLLKSFNYYYDLVYDGIELTYIKPELTGFMVYTQIPSENTKGLFYDVVIWYNSKDLIRMDTAVRIYSNSPHFGYSFANLYHRQGSLLFPHYYPQIILTDKSKIRNPKDIIFLDKHIYCSIKYTSQHNLNVKYENEFKDKQKPIIKTFDEKQKQISNWKGSAGDRDVNQSPASSLLNP